MVERWTAVGVHFVGVYIEEAHAVDEWPIAEAPCDVRQHRSLRERLDAARLLLAECAIAAPLAHRFYADSWPANPFNAAYASWPFRFWVVSRTAVLFKPMPRGATYDLNELEDFLRQYVAGRRD